MLFEILQGLPTVFLQEIDIVQFEPLRQHFVLYFRFHARFVDADFQRVICSCVRFHILKLLKSVLILVLFPKFIDVVEDLDLLV